MFTNLDNFQIGIIKSKKEVIYFKNKADKNYQIIYNHINDEYFVKKHNLPIQKLDNRIFIIPKKNLCCNIIKLIKIHTII